LPDDLLVKVDRGAWRGARSAAPWLDHRIIELVFRSSMLRVSRSERKILLRRLARRVLPPASTSSANRDFRCSTRGSTGRGAQPFKDVLASADPRLFTARSSTRSSPSRPAAAQLTAFVFSGAFGGGASIIALA
jgi:hypothetical protein